MKKIFFALILIFSVVANAQVVKPDGNIKPIWGAMGWLSWDTLTSSWDTVAIFPSATPTLWSSSGTIAVDTIVFRNNGTKQYVSGAAGNYVLKTGDAGMTGDYIINEAGNRISLTNGIIQIYRDYLGTTAGDDYSTLSDSAIDFQYFNSSLVEFYFSTRYSRSGIDAFLTTNGLPQPDYESRPFYINANCGLDINAPEINLNGRVNIIGASFTPTYKTTTGTLAKTDRFVLASGDITLTAPAITAADSGLVITVKNIGTYTDLVTFRIASTTADGIDTARIPRWQTRTIVAGNDGKWYTYEKGSRTDYVYDVSESGSFTTIQECIAFLDEHMAAPSVIRLGGGMYEVDETITIDLPYPLSIRGFSYQTTDLVPVTGIGKNPMFRCLSDVSLENFKVDATALSGYGDEANEDFVHFVGEDTYNEIKNFSLNGFWIGILDSTQAEIYVQEGDIENCNEAGIKLTGANDSVVFRCVTSDFIGCDKGIWLQEGSKAYVDIDGGCGFRNDAATDSAIVYVPTTFTDFINIYISGTTFNNVGKYISGFDFTRTDGRDANAYIDNNAGVESKNPHAYINVLNNASTTTITTGNTYYKAVFTNTSTYTCKFTLADNKMTYQPVNNRDCIMTISGNMSVNQNNRNLEICVIKNNNSAVKYGQMTVRTGTSGTASTFATTVYLSDVSATDYFEIFVTSPTSGDVITVQDVSWMANTQ